MGTFSEQASLSALPVPALADTLELYLETVAPLLSEAELAETRAKVDDFARGDGPKLQALLEERAKAIRPRDGPTVVLDTHHPDGSNYPNTHWLENWWETLAYQSDRLPIAVNVNCFQSHFKSTPCDKPLERTAWSIKAYLDGKRLLAEGKVPAERAGKAVLCSAQYLRIFSTTRVPGEQVDELRTYSNSKHMCVERSGHWYLIDNVELLSPSQLLQHLKLIKADAAARPRGPGVAALTGIDRTKWAKAREQLMRADLANVRTLELIESAITHFVLSEASPSTPDQAQALGQCGNGADIWFDKSGTNIAFENGVLITNIEHSAADAVVPARLMIYVDDFVQKNAPELGMPKGAFFPKNASGIPVTEDARFEYETPAPAVAAAPKVQRLDFVLDAELEAVIADARKDLAAVIDDNIVTCLELPDFGGKTISQQCKGVSTDSFVQMSLALAFFRDQKGEMPVTYETASTRSFFHGRTETIRPQSLAMRQFLQSFDDSAVPRGQVADLVREAANAHRNYLRKCMGGRGVDRHLLGLRVLAAENGMAPHAMFADKAYTKSTRFTLSTSQMPWPVEDWPGFGAYDPLAYAVCYRFTGANTIVATVASRKHTGNGKDARRFSSAIKTALRDMLTLLSANPPTQAKL